MLPSVQLMGTWADLSALVILLGCVASLAYIHGFKAGRQYPEPGYIEKRKL